MTAANSAYTLSHETWHRAYVNARRSVAANSAYTASLATARLLRDARDLLATEDRWTQNVCARDRAGNEVHTRHPAAHAFSLDGALRAAEDLLAPRNDYDAAVAVLERAMPSSAGNKSLAAWNDHPARSYDEIRDLLDAVIAAQSPGTS